LSCVRAQRWTSATVTGRCARGSPVLPSADTTQPLAVRARNIASMPTVAWIEPT
jgi:hypothetical protein